MLHTWFLFLVFPLFQCGGDIVIPLQPGLVTAWWPWRGNASLKMIAAEKTGNALLEINPDLLIIVGGILSNGNLVGVLTHPINLNLPEQLVYLFRAHLFFQSSHLWPSLSILQDCHAQHAGLVTNAGFNYSAPYWMGEFGSGGGNEKKWQIYETDHDRAYWSIDGYKYPHEGQFSPVFSSSLNNIV